MVIQSVLSSPRAVRAARVADLVYIARDNPPASPTDGASTGETHFLPFCRAFPARHARRAVRDRQVEHHAGPGPDQARTAARAAAGREVRLHPAAIAHAARAEMAQICGPGRQRPTA